MNEDVYYTIREGGEWLPWPPPVWPTYPAAIRRGCIVFDRILHELGECPWRYSPPLKEQQT